MATITLETLTSRVLGRAQMQSDDPGATNITDYINEGCKYLRALLREHRPSGFYIGSTPYPFTTSQNTQTTSLPDDFESLEGVDIEVSGRIYPAIEFEFGDRHKLGIARPWTLMRDGRVNARYTVLGDKLFWQDPPDGTYSGQIWYTSVFTPLVDQDDDINLWGYEQLVIDFAAKMCMDDDELDTTHLAQTIVALETKISKLAKRRNRGGHRTIRDVTGATWNLRSPDRERIP